VPTFIMAPSSGRWACHMQLKQPGRRWATRFQRRGCKAGATVVTVVHHRPVLLRRASCDWRLHEVQLRRVSRIGRTARTVRTEDGRVHQVWCGVVWCRLELHIYCTVCSVTAVKNGQLDGRHASLRLRSVAQQHDYTSSTLATNPMQRPSAWSES
jgi:hypothetical protein